MKLGPKVAVVALLILLTFSPAALAADEPSQGNSPWADLLGWVKTVFGVDGDDGGGDEEMGGYIDPAGFTSEGGGEGADELGGQPDPAGDSAEDEMGGYIDPAG